MLVTARYAEYGDEDTPANITALLFALLCDPAEDQAYIGDQAWLPHPGWACINAPARDKPDETRAVDELDEDVGLCCKRWIWRFTGKGDKPLQAEWSQ